MLSQRSSTSLIRSLMGRDLSSAIMDGRNPFGGTQDSTPREINRARVVALSRRKQGFESPWERHSATFALFQSLLSPSFAASLYFAIEEISRYCLVIEIRVLRRSS